MSSRDEKLVIANCSGFFGDRFSAAREMVTGGEIHVLTGDYLAELTMAILYKLRLKDPSGGYVPTFLNQMETIMGECLDRKIRVVANAGGLNPGGLAERLSQLAQTLGIHPRIAHIEGDDLMPRLAALQALGEPFTHLDKGIPLAGATGIPITANAYLGGWGITEALTRGADIVVTGRVTDASLVSGPAAWRFGWQRDDWDRLAGAVTAGHIIECGAQATGGNYAFMDEVADFRQIGFPIAEIEPDGSAVITKHPGTGGRVSVGTVTAQLLYDVRSPRYLNPDVVARFDTIALHSEGPDRVRVSGAKGEPPPETLKVCINTLVGYQNAMTLLVPGLDAEKKARVFEDALFFSLGGRNRFAVSEVRLIPSAKDDPPTQEEAFSYLRIFVMDPDRKRVDLLSTKIVELALASFPGFSATAPPQKATPAIVHWPALVSARQVSQQVYVDEELTGVDFRSHRPADPIPGTAGREFPAAPGGNTIKTPLGRIFAARSGDKGGNANLGVWAKTPEAYAFLKNLLDVAALKKLLPDMAAFEIERFEFPNLLAVNFYIQGVLGDGVAASGRLDPQAKTLGEYFRAKMVEIPETLLSRESWHHGRIRSNGKGDRNEHRTHPQPGRTHGNW